MYTDKRGIAALAAMMTCLAAPALAEDSTPASAEAAPALAPAPADMAQPVAEAPRPPPEARPPQGTTRRTAESGFTLGLRLGFGLPLGNVAENASNGSDVAMTDYVGSSIPVWIEPGFRLSRAVVLGGYFQYAFGSGTKLAGRACLDAGVSCSSHLMRVGVEMLYRFAPDSTLSPWFGIGTGYERLTISGTDSTGSADVWLSGWEYANLQVGLDRVVNDLFAIGPFATLSAGQYGTAGVSASSGDVSADIPRTATHLWFTFGVKGTFDF